MCTAPSEQSCAVMAAIGCKCSELWLAAKSAEMRERRFGWLRCGRRKLIGQKADSRWRLSLHERAAAEQLSTRFSARSLDLPAWHAGPESNWHPRWQRPARMQLQEKLRDRVGSRR